MYKEIALGTFLNTGGLDNIPVMMTQEVLSKWYVDRSITNCITDMVQDRKVQTIKGDYIIRVKKQSENVFREEFFLPCYEV